MAPKRRKSTANRKPQGRKTKATTRYLVSATFNMQKTVASKTDATKWLAKVKKAGGTGTMKKV